MTREGSWCLVIVSYLSLSWQSAGAYWSQRAGSANEWPSVTHATILSYISCALLVIESNHIFVVQTFRGRNTTILAIANTSAIWPGIRISESVRLQYYVCRKGDASLLHTITK